MRTSSLLILAGFAVASIHCSETSKTDGTSSTTDSPEAVVLKGHRDKGDAAVVMMSSNMMTCTGTVIAPKYVLTAAHCVGANGDLRSHSVHVDGIKVVRFHVPDGAVEETERNRWDHDVAVLELATPTSITPIPVNFDAAALDDIDAIRTVGFGRSGTNNDDSGVKRNGVARVTHGTNFIDTVPGTGGICYGDSGGPALADVGGRETIIGVTSHVSQHECERGRGVFVRTDRQRDFLSRFVDAPAPPHKQPPERDPIARREDEAQPPPQDIPPNVPPPNAYPHHRHHHHPRNEWPGLPQMNDGQLLVENGPVRITIDDQGRITIVQPTGTIQVD